MDYIEDWEDEPLHEQATRELVDRHRKEYNELRGTFTQARVAALERQVRESVDAIRQLREQNPDGISVPSLTDTANILASENDKLQEILQGMKSKIGDLESENRRLRDLVSA